jgi:transposase
MTRPPSIPADLWATFPIAAQAILAAQFERITQREARIADLEARLNQTSANSSLPPSADPPHAKPAPPRSPSGKRRGGQPGHPRAERALLPPDIVVPLKPARCRRCSGRLTGEDPDPLVHQVHEIPAVRPHVTGYRRHRLAGPGCGAVTCALLPADATGGYGPRAEAVCALLAGGHRLGKRAVIQVLGDLLGLPISPAAVCDLQGKTAAALEPAHAEALAYTRTRPANVDETGWTEGRKRAWLWAAVTTTVTAFLIRSTRGRPAFDDLVGPSPPVLTTDRYGVYTHLPGDQRQVCWAPLRRDFQAMIDRKNAGSGVGEDLLLHADILFRHGARVRDARPGWVPAALTWGGSGPRSGPCSHAGPGPPAPGRPGRAGSSWVSSRPCGHSRRSPEWSRRTTRPSGRSATPCAGGRRVMGRTRRPGVGSSSGCSRWWRVAANRAGMCSGSSWMRFRPPGPETPRRHFVPPGRERLPFHDLILPARKPPMSRWGRWRR